MFCGSCGNDVPEGVTVCPKCGLDLTSTSETQESSGTPTGGAATTGAMGGGGYRDLSSGATWLVKIPFENDALVDLATIHSWAKTRKIKPDTIIVDTTTDITYSAKQVPGVYSDKDHTTALLLSYFLGTLGVDRFYLGQTGLGIGKLLTGGGCLVWWIIDIVQIATRKVTDSSGRPLA